MEVNIFNFLPLEKTFVSLDKDLLKTIFGKSKSLRNLSAQINVPLKNLSRYKNGNRGIPANILLSLLTNSDISLDVLQNKIAVKVSNVGTPIKIGPKIIINEQWVYISELIRGDGHIQKNMWVIHFVNKEKNLIDIVNNFFLKFGIPESSLYIRKDIHGIYFLHIRSIIMSYLLSGIFEIQTGNKSSIIKLPKFIKNDKKFHSAAVRGFFDAEGTVQIGTKNYANPRRIVITSQSADYLKDLGCILNSYGIKSSIFTERNQDISRLIVRGQIPVRKFFNSIGSNHLKRKDKMQNLLISYSRTRSPQGLLAIKVLNMLSKGPHKRDELVENLNLPSISVGNQLKLLKKKKLVCISEKVYTNKRSHFKYEITDEGKEYLNQYQNFV